MANPYHHALSSVRKWGGAVEDYLPIHDWFDASKAYHGDFRHRILRHHAEGIFECEREFGHTLELSTCKHCGKLEQDEVHLVLFKGVRHMFERKVIPVRWVGEQHVTEDCGFIPSLSDWCVNIQPQHWMNNPRKLSKEMEKENKNG